jgi:hypothetical protein
MNGEYEAAVLHAVILTGTDAHVESKKAARRKSAAFLIGAHARRSVKINASRIALRDELCADQLFYARLHVHRV